MVFLQKKVGVVPGGFGESLRELRELREYSEEDLSKVTGIHVSIIKSLEEERVEDLLDPYYEERHVRTILTALEGRPAYFLEKYHALLKLRGVKQSGDILLKPRISFIDLFVSSRVIAFIGFLLLVLVIGIYVFWQIFELSAKPFLSVDVPIEGAILNDPSILVQGKTDPTAFLNVNGERAIVTEDGNYQIFLNIPSGVNTLRVEARRRYGSKSVIERHVIYQRPEREQIKDNNTSVSTTSSTQ